MTIATLFCRCEGKRCPGMARVSGRSSRTRSASSGESPLDELWRATLESILVTRELLRAHERTSPCDRLHALLLEHLLQSHDWRNRLHRMEIARMDIGVVLVPRALVEILVATPGGKELAFRASAFRLSTENRAAIVAANAEARAWLRQRRHIVAVPLMARSGNHHAAFWPARKRE